MRSWKALNLVSPLPEAKGLNLIPLNSIDHKVDCVLSNSFGFGGTNASLIFKSKMIDFVKVS